MTVAPTHDWIAIDCETTGPYPGCRLTELAAVRFADDGTVRDTFSALVDPGQPLDPAIVALTGIDRALLAGAADAATVLAAFRSWLPGGDAVLLAHNCQLDIDVIGWECERCRRAKPSLPVVDTLTLALALHPGPGGRMVDLVRHCALENAGALHRALPDADLTRQLFLALRQRLPAERFAALTSARPFANRWHYPRRWREEQRCVPAATAARRPLRFRYHDGRGRGSERAVIPFGYADTPQGIRFHGLCHLRDAWRVFALERCRFLLE